MSLLETAEQRADARYQEGGGNWLDHIALPQSAHKGGGPDEKVDMSHRGMGGEVRGMRDTKARMTRQLIEGGVDLATATARVNKCAARMERRLQ
jgi:hypothetical protein